MAEPTIFVLDSFALLAYLQDEAAASRVEKLLDNAVRGKHLLLLSLINLGEILYITERKGGVAKAQDTLALIQQLPLEIRSVNEQTIFAAAHIKANYSISYADSFAVVTAIDANAVIITSDPEFQSVETLVKVEWLPSS
jgi:predicted nucleic acid-binding protein